MLISGTFQEKLLDKIDKCVARVTIGRQVPHPCFFSTKIGLAENLGRWGLNESPVEPVRQDCLFSVGTCWAVVCQTESPANNHKKP